MREMRVENLSDRPVLVGATFDAAGALTGFSVHYGGFGEPVQPPPHVHTSTSMACA